MSKSEQSSLPRDSSTHFKRAILYDQNSVGLEYYQRMRGSLFEDKVEKCKIELFVKSSDDLRRFEAESKLKQPPQSVMNAAGDTKNASVRTTANSALVRIRLHLGKLRDAVEHTKHDFRAFLLNYCDVFPRFRESTIGFGFKKNETEIGPPRIIYRPLRSTSNGHGFECAYVLRHIEYTNRCDSPSWSLRQYAVYHRFNPNPEDWCSTLILLGMSERTENSIEEYANNVRSLKEASPFELHALFVDTALASWRPYIVDLLADVKDFSNRAENIMVIKGEDTDKFLSVDVHDHQQLKEIEDRTSDMMLCLDSSLDTVTTLISMTARFRATTEDGSADATVDVRMVLEEKLKEAAYVRKCAEALLAKVQNTRSLISAILERQSANCIQQQISTLHSLEREAQEETTVMRELTEKASRDSTSVRILTIITLIYLPCTVVASFYSTQFVKQEHEGGKVRMMYASNAWLFFAVSIPLTVVTILVWCAWTMIVRFVRARNCRPASNMEQPMQRYVRLLSLKRENRSLPQ